MFDAILDLFGFGPKARAFIRIRGHVYEGAYHRYTETRARAHSLKGWMRILSLPIDSFIELDVEGSRRRLDHFLNDLKRGPATAKVFAAEVQWKTYKGEFRDFRLRS